MESKKETNSRTAPSSTKENESGAGSSRVLRKLQSALDSGNYYEAHQTYRSLYFRYMMQKKYEELLQLLYEGSTQLLDRGQTTSGSDLALLMTEVLHKASYPVDEKILNRIEAIFERLIQPGSSSEENEANSDEGNANSVSVDIGSNRDTFVANLIKWTKVVSPKHKFGHPSLHARLASTWWRMKYYEQSRYHFLLSNDAEGCASFLVEYHLAKGYPNELDLFVAQAVLQFLCHKDKWMAQTVFFQYTRCHPRIANRPIASSSTVSKNSSQPGEPPYLMPLLNFVWLLLLCVDTGRVTDYSILIDKYQLSIRRDPSYREFLDRIGQLFFGLPPPARKANAGNAFLQNLMSGLLGDENETADDGPSSSTDADETYESVPGTPTSNDTPARPVPPKMTTDDVLD